MSSRDHRRRAEGYKVPHRRMPSPQEAKLGTQVHKTRRLEDEEYDTDVVQCEACNKYVYEDELELCEIECAREFHGRAICMDCMKKARDIEDEWESEAYRDATDSLFED